MTLRRSAARRFATSAFRWAPLLVAPMLTSPPDAQSPARFSHDQLSPVAVRSRVFTTATQLGRPGQLLVAGPLLIVVDASGNPWMHAIRLESGRIEASFGRKGRGPGEFEWAPWVAAPRGATAAVLAYDAVSGRLIQFTFNSDPANGAAFRPRVSRTATFDRGRGGVPSRVVSVTATQLAGVGAMFDSSALVFYDTTGKRLSAGGSISRAADKIPRSSIGNAYQGTACASPDGSRVARTYSYAGRIDIIGVDGTVYPSARVPFEFGPVVDRGPFNLGNEFKGGADNVRAGYYQCVTTDDFVLAKFSGKRNREFKGKASYSEYVHVFDWRGNLEGVIRLDHETIGLALSSDGQRLFTTTTWDDLEPAIRVTDIGNVLAAMKRD